VHADICPDLCHGVSNAGLIHLVVGFDTMKKIYGPNSSHKTSSIRDGCPFLINMSKILSTSNMRLFLNTFPHIQANLFLLSLSRGK
jgi:hypothetical protein